MIIVHACTMSIAHACTMIIVNACTMIIIRACTRIIVHACTMIIVHACTMISVHACTMLIIHARTMIIVHACRGSGGASFGIAGCAGAARPRFARGAGAARPRFAHPLFAGGFGGRHALQFLKIKPNFGHHFVRYKFCNDYFSFGGKKPNLEEFGLFWVKQLLFVFILWPIFRIRECRKIHIYAAADVK